MATIRLFALTLACLACLASLQAHSQPSSNAGAAPQSITITGRSSVLNSAGVAGFGDVPLAQSPYSGSVINLRQLHDAGISSLADITRLDAGTTDAYNAPGYWGQLAVRGYILDARFNYRRDGLPINAETVLPAANYQALELMKGISGLQAGTSAPGGLVNLMVKRPQGDFTRAGLQAHGSGEASLGVDISRRHNSGLAWRLNADAARLDPALRNAQGRSHLMALAVEQQLGHPGLLEVEVERSHQSQPSMPGFSLLGSQLPAARSIDPRTNLNNQAWTLPVVFDNTTASLRYTHSLIGDWQLKAQAMQQKLTTQDRVAFPYGCFNEDNYTRYCSDGTFDLYDYRSEGERRTTNALDVTAGGSMNLAGITHHLGLGVLQTGYSGRFNRQSYNYVGEGRINASVQTGSDPSLTEENTNRSESSTELRLQNRMQLPGRTSLWAGLRHTRLQRDSVRTDGSHATAYHQSFTTPWLGIGHDITPGLMAYANAGQGVESEVVPNRSRYINPGQPLVALKSQHLEVGLKHRQGSLVWNLAAFDIQRPRWADFGDCDGALSCTRATNGQQRHQGVEADAEWSTGVYSLRGSAMLLQARVQDARDPSQNGLKPTNVPQRTLKLQGAYNLPQVPNLSLLAFATHEGPRMVTPDNRVQTPGWTRLDLSARWTTRSAGMSATWRLGVSNVTDQRAWKEAPYQYGHAYLYPLPARAWNGSVNITL